MVKYVKAAVPPEHQKYKRILQDCENDKAKLGDALRDNPALYLSEVETKKSKSADGELASKKLKDTISELTQPEKDTKLDEEKNRSKFEQLFQMQWKHIEEVKNTVLRESDRTIEEITRAIHGPVDNILDKVGRVVSITRKRRTELLQ